MYRGFVMVYRKMTEWEWYQDVPVKVLFMHLLLTANHSSRRWEGVVIEAGENITSLDRLVRETGLSKQQVRTALHKLEDSKEITIDHKKRQYTKIKLNNWNQYQGYHNRSNTEITQQQHITNTAVTSNDNYFNNYNNESVTPTKVNFVPPTLEEVKNYVLSKALNMSAEKFYAHYEANGWMMGASKMQNWPAAVDKWALTEKEFNGNQISESDRDMDMSEDRIEYYRHNIPTIDDD